MNGPDGKRFVWGKILAIHTIGRFDIVEYRHKITTDVPDSEGPIRFHSYVDGTDQCNHADTLDSMLITAIALDRLGSNNAGRYAAQFIEKMLTPEKEQ